MVKNDKINTKSSLVSRPPVVCVLGHVDHGKTTLLDYIRKTKTHLVAKESGGITQHIGAYQAKIKSSENIITFIDTPGHAAFCKMRSRGANVADLAVLVVDAAEGLKPQTNECLKLIEEAKIPFIVALNKIDLPEASVDKVKSQLAEKGVLVEGYGGQIVAVPISAKTGKGVDELLEMIVLQAEMQELKANPFLPGQAVVIETKLDVKKGPLATLLVKDGTFFSGDYLVSDHNLGKIKAMFDENGRKINKAGPSKPVEILGFKTGPAAGVLVHACRQLKTEKIKTFSISQPCKVPVANEEESKKLKIILKVDVAGSLEAIKNNLSEKIYLISEGVGEVNESDVLLAIGSKAVILAFRVAVSKPVKKLAEYEQVKIKSYDIIYKLLEDLEKEVLRMIGPTIEETVLGEARVIAAFKIHKVHIAGCRVAKGIFSAGNKVHIKREGKLLTDSKIRNMQKNRLEVKSVKAGDEVGLVFSPDVDFKIGDDIISYNVV